MFDTLTRKYRDLQNRREDGEGGFTLIELLVVVVIIGILIAIAIPLYLNYTNGAKSKSVKADVRNAVVAVQQCYTDAGNTLPASQSFTATAAFTQTGCDKDQVTVSSDTTASIAYAKVDASNYTITGTDKDGKTVVYSTSGANAGQVVDGS